jgi:hypothetical protein
LGKRRDEDDGDSCHLLVVTMFSKWVAFVQTK